MTGIAGSWTGIDELRAASLDWTEAWEDNRVRAERFIEIGNRVLVLSRRTARGRRSGMPLDQALADIFTLRDGKIVRWEVYWDRHEGMRAAGFEG
jgi:ketosteroid isomerase-like protein